MNSDLESKIEITTRLYHYCQTVRCSKKLPKLAAEASRRELQFQRELEELEREKAGLPLDDGDEHRKAA